MIQVAKRALAGLISAESPPCSSPVSERPRAAGLMSGAPVSMAERELLAFIDSVRDMFGPDQDKFLTEIWLDALASMDCMPGPLSPDWHLVTLVASIRLAAQLVEIPNRSGLFGALVVESTQDEGSAVWQIKAPYL